MATEAELTTGSASAAAEHTEEPQLHELVTQEAGLSTEIKSLDDLVSKLSSDSDDSAAALRSAVQTLQRAPSRRQQAEVRNLCKPWGVKLTAKNDKGNYTKRADAVLKRELKDKVIAKAKEHFRASRFGSGTSPP